MSVIRWPADYERGRKPSVADLGGKGRALALLSTSMPIPPWFALTPAAFNDDATADSLTPDVAAELVEAVGRLCPDGSAVAVRSSAADEDSATFSFAGQLESYLFVAPRDVAARVMDVWRSAKSARVREYRREHGVPEAAVAPAVIVQRMIDADVSGVAFSADPITGSRDIAVVSALWGLGTALVSGECDADTFRVDSRGNIAERVLASKRIAHRRAPESPEGVRAFEVAAPEIDRPSLSDEGVRQVAQLVRRAEEFFHAPQDIEWAMQAGTLYLLQARPITTLASAGSFIPGAVRLNTVNVWDNSNIAESYGGVTTPLTFSFARHAYEGAYRQFCRLLKIPEATIAANDNVFRNMLGFIRGRVYYNLLNWYRVLALLPGYRLNRHFMEQMMGVKEELPDGLVAAEPAPSALANLKDSCDVFVVLCALLAHFATLQSRIDRFYARMRTVLGSGRPDYSAQSPVELAAAYRDMEGRLLTHWDAPLLNDLFAMIFFGTLRRLCVRWCGAADGTLQNGLIGGEGGMVSAEPAQRIRQMAQLAARDDELAAALARGSVDEAQAALTRMPELRQRYDEYLERFGDRTTDELKLESPTLLEDPLMLLRAIGRLAAGGAVQPAAGAEVPAREQAECTVGVALAGHPLRRAFFRWVLRHARARVLARENLRFERTRLFGRIRALFSEIGRQFARASILAHPADVFYLEIEEIIGFVEGTATTAQLGKLATLRRQEFDLYRHEPPPPDRFETVGMVGSHTWPDRPAATLNLEGDTRSGIGCCPGVVRGPVRVVTDPRNATLEKGDILVAERTDPGWVMLFPSAAGLLVERGSLLSHSAIVAREMRLPAIVSINGVTQWLKNGDWVEFDGSSGVVRRVPKAAAAEDSRARSRVDAHA